MPEIAVHAVSKRFESRGTEDVDAVSNVSFTAGAGEFVCIVGPSGCGKTTLLKIVGDLLPATRGAVTIGGLLPQAARKEGIFSWVFQAPVLLPWRNLLQNVTLPIEIQPSRKARDPRALLELVGLRGFERHLPSALSGGMQQRAALARALIFYPRVLLMDEPFSAIDEFTRATLNVELSRLAKEIEVTVLFVTHNIAEAVFLGDRVIVLSRRPGTIKAIVDVPLAHPRVNSLRSTGQFQEIVQCVESQIA